MRTLVHLSDLHFGRVDGALPKPLIAMISEINPDAVVISGDLTQRARPREFEQARSFLDALPKPQIVVPGNHDVPLHNVWNRFNQKLNNFRDYITSDLEPYYSDSEIAILGLNTARSLTFKGGRINKAQIARIAARLCPLDKDIVKILVTHHPFDLSESYPERELVGRAPLAMIRLAHCKVDLLLAGHLHVSHTGQTSVRYKIAGHSAVFVQAGTAISTRGRGESNSFNVLRIERPLIDLQRFSWDPDGKVFLQTGTERFSHASEGWVRA